MRGLFFEITVFNRKSFYFAQTSAARPTFLESNSNRNNYVQFSATITIVLMIPDLFFHMKIIWFISGFFDNSYL
jgi:hypothetical protein